MGIAQAFAFPLKSKRSGFSRILVLIDFAVMTIWQGSDYSAA